MEDVQNKEEETVDSPIGEQSIKRKHSLSDSDSDNEDSDQPTPKRLSHKEELRAKMEKFSKLRSRMVSWP
jgi:hypothetical protein